MPIVLLLKGALIGSFQTVQLNPYLNIVVTLACQIHKFTATKQLNVIHLHEKQATPLSFRIFSFEMILLDFHPVNLQQTSFKQ